MRRAIINVASGSWYPRGQKRLVDSLETHGERADRLLWTDRLPKHSPSHSQEPYGFKVYGFLAALMNGYDQCLWLDSSVMLCKPLTQIWDWTTEDGYCFGNDGWHVGQWCNDAGLETMGLTREEAWKVPLMDGKLIALDFNSKIGMDFLRGWKDYLDKGVFRGEHYGPQQHRHDITAGAVVAHRLGMKLRTEFVTMGTCADGTFVKAYGL